ncbi:polysaccharide biosynthesis tyrosine autokinase [candidate division KSB1 bacterium]|nr:polysaccharide biosynthesis tyrosine autokinase [candidate division KSB1 bacterium]
MDNKIEIKEVTLRDYIDLLLRRKWTVIFSFVLVFSIAIYHNFTQPPVYESLATFMIENQEPMIPLISGVKMNEPARPFEFYNAVVTSRIFRAQTVDEVLIQLQDSAGIKLPVEEAWGLLSKNLSVKNPEYSDFIELHAKANDPKIAYILANVAAKTLKARCQEIDREESMNVVNFVNDQKIEALKDLESVEKALQEFKEKNDALIAGENGGLVKELVEMEAELMSVETQRELAESNLLDYTSRLEKMDFKVNQSLNRTESPEVKNLRDEIEDLEDLRNSLLQVTGKSSEIKNLERKIDSLKRDLINTIIRSALNPGIESGSDKILWEKLLEQKVTEELSVATLKNRETFYQNLINNFKKRHPNLLEMAITLEQLKRAKGVHEKLYSYLLEKGEEAKIEAATGTGGIRIVDPPNWPDEPNPRGTMKNLLLGALLGMGLGIGLAFFRDYLDNTVRTPDDITRVLKLPVMGVIPMIREKKQKSRSAGTTDNSNGNLPGEYADYVRTVRLITNFNPKDPIVETYRGLRTNLQFAEVDKKLRSLVITSSSPQEGKTVTAANLALAYAEVGLKTLLVDTDLRKPKQHILFNCSREPGLMEFLVGEKTAQEICHPVKNSNLKVVPSGKIPPNPTQVLSSQKMENFIQMMEDEYDIVIFDSPPLAAVTDPVLIARKVGGVVLVVRFQFTDLNVAMNSLEVLHKAHGNVLGVVLNSTEFSAGYGHYYHYYNYYHEYASHPEQD